MLDLLSDDPHLEDFIRSSQIPGKGNGLDFEGIAVRGRPVFIGLRGPVLREWAVVIEFSASCNAISNFLKQPCLIFPVVPSPTGLRGSIYVHQPGRCAGVTKNCAPSAMGRLWHPAGNPGLLCAPPICNAVVTPVEVYFSVRRPRHLPECWRPTFKL